MFRHTGLESFRVTHLEAKYIGGDSHISTIREHKVVSLAGAEGVARTDWVDSADCYPTNVGFRR